MQAVSWCSAWAMGDMQPLSDFLSDFNSDDILYLLRLEALPVLAQLICAALAGPNLQPRHQALLPIDVIHLPPLRVAQHLHHNTRATVIRMGAAGPVDAELNWQAQHAVGTRMQCTFDHAFLLPRRLPAAV